MVSQRVFLDDIRVAVLAADGFERKDYDELLRNLLSAGAKVDILAPHLEQMRQGIQALQGIHLAKPVQPDRLVQDVSPDDYQALLILGGAMSVDRMRDSRLHLAFVQRFMDSNRLIGVVSHGPWLLADSGAIQGKTLTSAPTIRKDLERAGGIWKDLEFIEDGNLLSSRGAADIPVFERKLLARLGELYRVSGKVA